MKTDKTRVESGLRAVLSVDALAVDAFRGGEWRANLTIGPGRP